MHIAQDRLAGSTAGQEQLIPGASPLADGFNLALPAVIGNIRLPEIVVKKAALDSGQWIRIE